MENQTTTEFKAPRHWIGLEELDSGYWSDSANIEKRGQEFHDKPIEAIAAIDASDEGGFARREFLTLMGASMAMASIACARKPVHKIIPYVNKPEEITPGVPNWYASTDPETGYGLLVKTREARPIKLEGNPDNPINRGAISARTQASLLDLYDVDRQKNPLIKTRGAAGGAEATWDQVDQEIVAKIRKLVGSGKKVRVLSSVIKSPSTRRLIQEALGSYGELVEFDSQACGDLIDAQALSYGSAVMPTYHFDKAEMVVSLGADFLGTWNSPIQYSTDWIKKRKLIKQKASQAELSKLVVFESMMSVTGANSDERYPVRPGDELKIAMALAYEVVKGTRFAADASVMAVVSGYKPEIVANEIGFKDGAQSIKNTASLLIKNRGKSLVVAGGPLVATKDSIALQIAVNLLNSALENEGKTVEAVSSATKKSTSFVGVAKLISEMNAGTVGALVTYRLNGAYLFPKSSGFQEAVSKVPLVVTVSDRDDEMARFADYLVPDHHFLENWGDAEIEKDVFSLQQPVIAPLHNTRAFQDTLIAWTKRAGGSSGLIVQVQSWHEYLMANWRDSVFKSNGAGQSFDKFWENSLRVGVVNGARGRVVVGSRQFNSNSVSKISKYQKNDQALTLGLYHKVSMGDGSQANNGWIQEMPDPITTITWDNYLNIGAGLAKKMDLKSNDVVEMTSGDIKTELPVHIQPGHHDGAVSAALGYGRTAAGQVGSNQGIDVTSFMTVEGDRLVYSGQSVSIKKTGKLYRLAETQWHNASENRPIINDITLAEYRKNPESANHTDPHLKMKTVPSLWPAHEYKGYRWGMSIDLTSCTGCGACVIACQAENNIPVVGRSNVRVSREMHWIRIDRYYSGSADQPQVVFQPMLCQHCENAPCETVCPVLATVHSDEGLNDQVYNRCVGTRYCQNNCPYKVRRFNFFDHWKDYKDTMNLAWNPDVTVRMRGIMEKCTFCTQRITEAKLTAKEQGKKVEDGTIKTACQQTCPTDAIVFGDINDPKTEVSKLHKEARGYRVLEVLNTKPAVTYLTKVRNVDGHQQHHS